MKSYQYLIRINALLLALFSNCALAFDSGSTGADGAFNPTVSQTIALPADGIFNYTSVNIPAGVTITYQANAVNTPVIILVQNDALIDGDIDIRGQTGTTGVGGVAGPGGFPGGQGASARVGGGRGFGPGGADGGTAITRCGGFGGGHSLAGSSNNSSNCNPTMVPGVLYGSRSLIPLIGGSGGGGGAGPNTNASTSRGGNGGGGGGAILIAVSGTLTLNGNIFAMGGDGQTTGASTSNSSNRGDGGGGSGGSVRLVATTLAGSGRADVLAGAGGPGNATTTSGGDGAPGRLRFEAETFQYAGTVGPSSALTNALPQPLNITNPPSVQITTIDGQTVVNPVSNALLLPEAISDPATVGFAATGVPLGNVIELTVQELSGPSTTALSTALTGTVSNSTASASLTLPQGRSVLTASVSFTVVATNQMDYSNYAMGKPVKMIKIETNTAGLSETTFITLDDESFTWPTNAIAMQ